jgi:hypothetical protein
MAFANLRDFFAISALSLPLSLRLRRRRAN